MFFFRITITFFDGRVVFLFAPFFLVTSNSYFIDDIYIPI